MGEEASVLVPEPLAFIQFLIQLFVILVLVWHGMSFKRQLSEARRDEMVKVRLQLFDFYIRYSHEPNKRVQKDLRGVMRYLLADYDELYRRVNASWQDEFLHRIGKLCHEPPGNEQVCRRREVRREDEFLERIRIICYKGAQADKKGDPD